jgi:hypothetical protein
VVILGQTKNTVTLHTGHNNNHGKNAKKIPPYAPFLGALQEWFLNYTDGKAFCKATNWLSAVKIS